MGHFSVEFNFGSGIGTCGPGQFSEKASEADKQQTVPMAGKHATKSGGSDASYNGST